MALNLVLGSSGAGKTYYLCNKMLQDIHERKIDNYIYYKKIDGVYKPHLRNKVHL